MGDRKLPSTDWDQRHESWSKTNFAEGTIKLDISWTYLRLNQLVDMALQKINQNLETRFPFLVLVLDSHLQRWNHFKVLLWTGNVYLFTNHIPNCKRAIVMIPHLWHKILGFPRILCNSCQPQVGVEPTRPFGHSVFKTDAAANYRLAPPLIQWCEFLQLP